MAWFDETLVVLTDKYPKARTHYLVLARDTSLAAGPSALRAQHAELVERMATVGRRIAAEKAAKVNGAKQSRFALVFTQSRRCRRCTCTSCRVICAGAA